MNLAKNSSRSIPSTRLTMSVARPSSSRPLPMASSASAESTTSGMSLVIIVRSIFIGTIMAVTPMITNTLNILLPTTLPMASSGLPCNADTMLITSSGADVPNATTVRPTIRSETPQRLAMADAPSVSMLAPSIISARPTIKNTISRIISQR